MNRTVKGDVVTDEAFQRFSPRKSNPNLPMSTNPKVNRNAQGKTKKRPADKRQTGLEKTLDNFKFTDERHMDWLEKQRSRYGVHLIGQQNIHDRDFNFCIEMTRWLQSQEGEKYRSNIAQSWARFYSKFTTHYGVSMPNLTHKKLRLIAKKEDKSLNATVFELIHRAYAESKKTPLEKVLLNRFDKLEEMLKKSTELSSSRDLEAVVKPEVSLQDKLIELTRALNCEMNKNSNLVVSSEVLLEFENATKGFNRYQKKLKKKA
ncbi:hypothetical protein [Vibrio algivorus]|uniref:Uncharacterized protein n=1 Tax=Vibrio algivorus TaxID=1667024 RepID=A0A557P6I1_9VIBR|nr:hypothetical protein [Vibrio algivorus]TVO36272.1 hypothetical protein FOF44_10215 [Vibrio algivorus]